MITSSTPPERYHASTASLENANVKRELLKLELVKIFKNLMVMMIVVIAINYLVLNSELENIFHPVNLKFASVSLISKNRCMKRV